MRRQGADERQRAKAGNVAKVADAVGFASVSAFSRRFPERFRECLVAFSRHRGISGRRSMRMPEPSRERSIRSPESLVMHGPKWGRLTLELADQINREAMD